MRTDGTIKAASARFTRATTPASTPTPAASLRALASEWAARSRTTHGAKITAGIGGATLTTTSGNVDISAASSFNVDAAGLGFTSPD